MTGALLRTGTLKAFEPLGALGNPVYLAASQLRAAIGRRLGQEAADVLAIPHRNQDGDTIDWYASRPGPVVPWSAATPEERAQAKEQLLGIRERIEDLGQAMQSEDAGERQVFGRLLEHVTSFPDDSHVYLVDGRPVIAFWGFRHQNAPVDSNPLLNLDVAPRQPPTNDKRGVSSWWWLLLLLILLAILLASLLRGCGQAPSPAVPSDKQGPASEPATSALTEEQTPQQEEPPLQEPVRPEPELVVDRKRPDFVARDGETRILEHDGVIGAPGTVVEADRVEGSGSMLQDEGGSMDVLGTDELRGVAETEAEALEPGAGEPETEVLPVEAIEEASPADDFAAQAPPATEAPEDGAASEPPAEPPGSEEETNAEPPTGAIPEAATPDSEQSSPQPPEPLPPAEAGPQGESGAPELPAGTEGTPPDAASGTSPQSLNLPPGAVSRGSTQFLNGAWRTSTSLQDPGTALPVDMEYRLRDGAGRLSLKRSDGSVCSGQVKAVIEDGKLVVQNARDIRCPDGTNFGRPRLECVPGKDGRADCSGRYETGEVFSVDIKKSQEQTDPEAAPETATRKSDEEK